MNANAVIAANEATIAQLQKDTVDVTTLDRFLQYAADAANWSGTPLVGGNVGGDASDKGYIVNMKKRGLVTTFKYDGDIWMHFTDEGVALAAQHGITIEAGNYPRAWRAEAA